jgi:hypothetical protein
VTDKSPEKCDRCGDKCDVGDMTEIEHESRKLCNHNRIVAALEDIAEHLELLAKGR